MTDPTDRPTAFRDRVNTMTWFEIASDDPAATKKFYEEVFGWSYTDTGWAWSLIKAPDYVEPIGDIWDSSEDQIGLMPPNGITMNVFVEDVDVSCERVVKAGGTVVVPPMGNEDGTIRVALVRDIKGNLLALGRPAGDAG